MRRWPIVCAVWVIASPAWALKPAKHRELAEAACAAVQLPEAFCRRMGQQVYETDDLEWTDLAAHAQRELGQDRCAAADAAVTRVDALAREAVADVHAGRLEDGAVALGRAIHTLQDECAHHGMTNQEHAFYSLEDTCGSAPASPDTKPEAIACADTRTQVAFRAVATALADASWSGVYNLCTDGDNRDTCAQAALPSPIMACEFLAEYQQWDGGDSTWNASVVGPALETAFAAALAGQPSSPTVCGGDPHAIDPLAPHATVTDRDAGCTLTDIFCLGKVDGEAPAKDTAAGGCNASGGASLWLVAVVSLGGCVLRSSRSRSRSRRARTRS